MEERRERPGGEKEVGTRGGRSGDEGRKKWGRGEEEVGTRGKKMRLEEGGRKQ